MRTPVLDRILPKFELDTSGCWTWLASKGGNGYAQIDDECGKTVRVHRVLYELVVGPIGAGLELDHLCRNRACINPDHLEPVTHQENMRRAGAFRRRSHCPQGHPYDEENTVVVNTAKGPERRCRTCKRQQLREWRKRNG